MADRKTQWVYEMAGSTQNAKSSRSSVRKPDSFRMIGFEAALEGPPGPFPGFIEVHRLTAATFWGGASHHDESSEITDFKPFNIIIGDSDYGYGFIFRARRKTSSSTCDVFMVLWSSVNGEWHNVGHPYTVLEGVPLPRDLDGVNGRQMSIAVVGRLIYVFVEDQEPVLVRVPRSYVTSVGFVYEPEISTNTGPGLKPILISPRLSGGLGSITVTGDPNRPGAGQIFLTEFLPEATGLFPTGDYGGGSSTTGGASGTATTGGSGVDQTTITKLKPGDYAFCYVLYDSTTGRRSALSEVAEARKDDFDPDGPLTTHSSGTVSGGLDPIPLYAAIEICYDKTLYDQAYIYRSVRVQDAGGTYIATIYHLDKIIDLVEYHTTNNPLANPNVGQSVYWYELEDKQLAVQSTFGDPTQYDENMPKGGAALWYENTMLVSSIKGSSLSSSEEVRRDDGYRGVGEIRWSSLTEVSPELFPPSNRYYPPLPSNDVLVMKQVGPNVVGFSRDRQYIIRKESVYAKVLQIHEGFGVANEVCVDSVGSLLYFLGTKGLKSVDANAQLDDVLGIQQVVLEQWNTSIEKCSLAFDPAMSVLFVFNREEEEMACFWFNTAQITMVQDLPFREVTRGSWPSDFQFDLDLLDATQGVGNATYYNPLVERAFFVQNPPKNTSGDIITGFRHRIFMVDYKREKTHDPTGLSNQTLHSLFPTDSDVVFTVGADFSSGTTLTLDGTYTMSNDSWGYRLYVLEAEDTTLLHKQATIHDADGAPTEVELTDDTASELYGLKAGDKVGMCPVYVRWEGSPVATQDENGQDFSSPGDMFRTKQVDSIGCAFCTVSGSTLSLDATLARFRGHVYRGNRTEPTATGDTRDRAGEYVRSITEDEGVYQAPMGGTDTNVEGRYGIHGAILTPSVSVVCPGLYFQLVGVMVKGSVKESERTARAQ